MKNISIHFCFVVFILFSTTACNRFLDEKSDVKLTTPETLEDNQALLDRATDIITNFAYSGMISSDDFYITDADFKSLPYDEDRRLYTWQPDYVSRSKSVGNDWYNCYRSIYIANAVIYNLDRYNISNSENVKGQALAWRAIRYLDAAQIWCVAYDKNTAMQQQGLPLRLDPDMNVPSHRSSLQETYTQILLDLKEAEKLLPLKQIAVTRPSKITALSYLARVYLYMGDYENALDYGLRALQLQNTLIDFNLLNVDEPYPIKDLNVEMLLKTSMGLSEIISGNTPKVLKDMYNMYDSNDLRKAAFFSVTPSNDVVFKGYYTGSSNSKLVSVAIDEVYLTVAESYARLNDTANAMQMLNNLLVARWKRGTFVSLIAKNKDEALRIIAVERQKELICRGVRWSDIKRYNRDGANITLSRNVEGKSYTLPPNDLRYAIAIPEEIINLAHIPQNKR